MDKPKITTLDDLVSFCEQKRDESQNDMDAAYRDNRNPRVYTRYEGQNFAYNLILDVIAKSEKIEDKVDIIWDGLSIDYKMTTNTGYPTLKIDGCYHLNGAKVEVSKPLTEYQETFELLLASMKSGLIQDDGSCIGSPARAALLIWDLMRKEGKNDE